VSPVSFRRADAKAFPSVRAGVHWGARVGEAINWGVPSSRLLRPSCAPTTSRAPRGGGPRIGAAAARKVRVRALGLPELSALKAAGFSPWRKGVRRHRA